MAMSTLVLQLVEKPLSTDRFTPHALLYPRAGEAGALGGYLWGGGFGSRGLVVVALRGFEEVPHTFFPLCTQQFLNRASPSGNALQTQKS